MNDDHGDLFGSIEKSPTYWMQVALLEFLQSLDAMSASKGVFTRKELAKRIGVSAPTLSRWLNGNENITVSSMCRLATALGAAVHIHVADKNERGRWRPEIELAHARPSSSEAQMGGTVVSFRKPRIKTSPLVQTRTLPMVNQVKEQYG